MPYMALSSAASKLKRLMEDLPLADERVLEAEGLIKQCSEAELAALGLGPPPRPAVPRMLQDSSAAGGKDCKLANTGSPQQRLNAVQQVINSLQYNHTPGYYYNVSKSRPFSRVMETAREVVRAALPIKCLEAVFLGTLLTAGWHDVDRLPLAFKSTVQGQTYRHIVLVVFHGPSRKWGALGLSRRPELMDKDLVYDSLADLVQDYKEAYERWWHKLARVYVGLPLEHDTYYAGPVCWRYLTLSLTGRKSWMSHRAALDNFAGQAKRLAAKFRALGVVPSLGGADSQQQGQGSAQPYLESHGRGGSAAAGASAGGVSAVPGTGAAAGAARYAKSVSPASRQRRPAPPQLLSSTMPLTKRPATPTRQRAIAASGSCVVTSGVGGSAGQGRGMVTGSPARLGHGSGGVRSCSGGSGGVGHLATATQGKESHSGAASQNPSGDSTVGGRTDNGESKARTSENAAAAVACTAVAAGAEGGASSVRVLPRRSSDPGGGTASLAAVADAVMATQEACMGAGGKAQERELRQRLMAEERGGAAARPDAVRNGDPSADGRGGPDGDRAGRVGGAADEDEEDGGESESDEDEYMSEGSDSEGVR